MDAATWDRALQRLGGPLLQSWRWGAFKHAQGWAVERIQGTHPAGAWMAQVLFKPVGPLSLAYVPCGPVLAGDHRAIFPDLVAALDEACRRHRAVTLIMEPNQHFGLAGSFKGYGFVRWATPFQPRLTLRVPALADEALLAGMHHKTRAHVRRAMREGIAVARLAPTASAVGAFHRLLSETAARNGIALLSQGYVAGVLRAFGDDAALLVATVDGEPVAADLTVRFGAEATYLFAASAARQRGQGAGAYLVYETIRWARAQGCARVDLGNVEPAGLRVFKSGFGGEVCAFPAAMERRYRPLLAWAAGRALAARRGV